MSSIRFYILDALVEEGPMHGHQLRLLAEKEHVQEWTDFSVGGLYGALKRLAADGLIEEVRAEREGAYPERQVYQITDAGRVSLGVEKRNALLQITMRADPFDLAMARLDRTKLDELADMLTARIARLRALFAETIAHNAYIAQYLTVTEKIVIGHRVAHIQAEIAWHEELLNQLPNIIADESAREES